MSQSNATRAHRRLRNVTGTHDDTGTRPIGGVDNGHVPYTITHIANIARAAHTINANATRTYYVRPIAGNASATTMADEVCSNSGAART